MDKLLDKMVLFGLCLALYITMTDGLYAVVPVVAAVIVSNIETYFSDIRVKALIFAGYSVACIMLPQLLLFLPLFCYDFPDYWIQCAVASFIVTAFVFVEKNYSQAIISALIISISFVMSYRTEALSKARAQFFADKDSARESLLKIQSKNKELLERQDYEISVATLSERNRIARDIHDSVGHILSRSLLQVGAMIATAKDPLEKEKLTLLKESLSQGMDSIRKSLHNLYDESCDLYAEIKGIADSFSFCRIYLDYDVKGNPEKKIKYAFIAIVKESLTNIEKHSKATYAKVILREQPGFYILSVADNGVGLKKSETADGIGLRSIETRVKNIGGLLNISGENGFRIYISVPKEVVDSENSFSRR